MIFHKVRVGECSARYFGQFIKRVAENDDYSHGSMYIVYILN